LQIETGKGVDPRHLSASELERLIGELSDDEPRDLSHLPDVFTREDFYEDRL